MAAFDGVAGSNPAGIDDPGIAVGRTGQAAAALWCCLTEAYGEMRVSARARLEKVNFLAPATILFG